MSRRPKDGFTLIEAMLAAVVLAITVVAVVAPFAAGARSQQVEMRMSLAVGLAEQLMEEILQKPFEEPDDGDTLAEDESAFGPEADEATRADFDAIDDYHGQTEAAGQIRQPDGTLVTDPAATGLSRHVTVQYVLVAGQDAADDKLFLRVTVEVRHEGQPLVTLTRLAHWTAN